MQIRKKGGTAAQETVKRYYIHKGVSRRKTIKPVKQVFQPKPENSPIIHRINTIHHDTEKRISKKRGLLGSWGPGFMGPGFIGS